MRPSASTGDEPALVREPDITSTGAVLISNRQSLSNQQRAILDVVRETLLEVTGKTFDDERDWYARVRDTIGAGHHPNYYRKVIRSNPSRYVPTPTPRYGGEPA